MCSCTHKSPPPPPPLTFAHTCHDISGFPFGILFHFPCTIPFPYFLGLPNEKVMQLRAAIKAHTNQVKRCATGNDVDRHLYALYCLWSKYHAKSHTRHVDAKKHLQKRKAISDLQSGGSVAATSERTELDSGAGASAEANSSRGGGSLWGFLGKVRPFILPHQHSHLFPCPRRHSFAHVLVPPFHLPFPLFPASVHKTREKSPPTPLLLPPPSLPLMPTSCSS